MPIKSILKEVVQAFPEGQTIKGSNIEAMLKKKGVKPEEINFAGLTIDDAARYDKAELEALEAGRKDVFETKVQPETQFDWVSLHDEATNPTYKEKVITFSQPKLAVGQSQLDDTAKQEIRAAADMDPEDAEEFLSGANIPSAAHVMQRLAEGKTAEDIIAELDGASRYTSGHFRGQENYLMHTRVYDDTIDGTPTRVLQEVQSDLHQQGRQFGYEGEGGIQSLQQEYNEWLEQNSLPAISADDLLYENITSEQARYLHDFIQRWETAEDVAEAIPLSPYQKTWLRKGIERELVDAMNEGRQQLAIPIKGNIAKLQRGEGVQRWYETQVLNTAKKVAKDAGADFEVKRVGTGKPVNIFDPKERIQLAQLFGNMTDSNKGQTIDDMLENARINTNPEIVSILQDIKAGTLLPSDGLAKLSSLTQEAVIEYAIIKPTAESAKKTFSLYSTPVAGAFAAYTALRQGATEEELNQYLASQGHDAEDIAEAIDKAKMIQTAVTQGATEEEVREYLMGQQPQEQAVETMESVSVARAQEILASAKNPSSWFSPAWVEVDLPADLVEEERLRYQADLKRYREESFLPAFLEPEGIPGRLKPEAQVYKNLKDKVDNYKALVGDEEMSLPDFTAKMEAIYPNMMSVLGRTAAWAGNEENMQTAKQAELASRLRIIQQAEKLGVTLEYVGAHGLTDPNAPRPDIGVVTDAGRWVAVLPDGAKVDADPTFWASISAETGEIGSAIAGGVWGAQVAAARTPGGVRAKALSGLLGSILGAAGLSAVGSQVDYMVNAMAMHQDLDASIASARARDAAQASALGDAIAFPVFKAIGVMGKGAVSFYRRLRDGDLMGANTALKEMMALSDDEAAAIVQQAERVMKLEGSQASKEISSFITTQPGGEAIMSVVGTMDTTAKRIVSLDIDKRAKDLMQTSGEFVPDRIDKVLSQDLDNYITDVKTFYGEVKAQAANTPNSKKWSFDYNALGINPVLDAMQAKIDDVPALERFMLKAQRIRERADGRTFADLLDLRQMVNGFIYGKGTKKATELQAFKELIGKIDESIKQGSDVVLENPKEWREHWALARRQYAEMKSVEKNVLFKALTAPGVDDKIVVKKMVRYITSGDETWTDVMAKLPEQTRASAEHAVIDSLVNKFAKGEGLQAINYPGLSEELSRTTFTTPEARKLKGAIERLGRVFQNDIPLLEQSGGITIPRAAQALTTDITAKAHYSLMSSVWTKMQQFLPGKAGRKAALLNKAADLLENPLNVKTAKELMDEVGPSVNLAPKVLELQRQAAAEAAQSHSATVRLYGTGNVLSPKGTGKETRVHISRIATQDIAAQVAEAEGIAPSNIKALEFALKQRGYQAIVLGTEKVKLL